MEALKETTAGETNDSGAFDVQPAKKHRSANISRARKQPDRLGINTEENDDNLFDAVRNQNERVDADAYPVRIQPILDSAKECDQPGSVGLMSPAANTLSNHQLDALTPGEKLIFEQLILLKKEVTVLQRTIEAWRCNWLKVFDVKS